MGTVKREDIVGMWDGKDLVCEECMADNDWNKLTEDKVIKRSEVENDPGTVYFCDRCKKHL